MFLKTSRYAQLPQTRAALGDGRMVTVITLRRLPTVQGVEHVVKGNDRLDIIAERRYGDGARFWHIADANTELQARDLIREPGRGIRVAEQ